VLFVIEGSKAKFVAANLASKREVFYFSLKFLFGAFADPFALLSLLVLALFQAEENLRWFLRSFKLGESKF